MLGAAAVDVQRSSRIDDGRRVGVGVGSLVGPYRLTREIGHGGMGSVFEAVHTALEKRVAVKTLHPHIDVEAVRQRFRREGRAAARVRHPNTVEVFDTGVHRGVAYLVMEYLDGEDLEQVLAREGRLPLDRAADLMLPVAAAIAAAHEQGIIHRDLKPANIFLARSQGEVQPKVLDFGIARLLDEDLAGRTTVMLLGTPQYMSPEQAQDSHDVSARSDQYSLGVILYECVTGRPPFDHEALFALLEAVVRGPFDPPRRLRPELPEAFEAVILRAMERDPAERFASVSAFGRALLPFASPAARARWEPVFNAPEVHDSPTLPDGTQLSTARSTPSRPPARPAWMTAFASALATITVVLSLSAWARSRPRPGDARSPTAAVVAASPAPARGPAVPPTPVPDPAPVAAQSQRAAAPSTPGVVAEPPRVSLRPRSASRSHPHVARVRVIPAASRLGRANRAIILR